MELSFTETSGMNFQDWTIVNSSTTGKKINLKTMIPVYALWLIHRIKISRNVQNVNIKESLHLVEHITVNKQHSFYEIKDLPIKFTVPSSNCCNKLPTSEASMTGKKQTNY